MRKVDLRNKNVLIAGGLGFIGSNLAHECVELGAKVTIFDNNNPFGGGNAVNIDGLAGKIDVVDGDILNYDDIARQVVDQDIIFNCAASTSHPFSMREPLADLDVNGKGMINLLEALRRKSRKTKLVHIGTTTQMGELKYQPADEDHAEFPTDVYSASKSLSEKYALIYGKSYSIPVTVLRFPNIYGPRARINSSDFTFVNYFIGLALVGKSITVYGDGKQLRNLVYVSDAVDALVAAALEDKVNGEVMIATSDEHLSVKSIAKKITEVFGSSKVKLVRWPRRRKAIEVGDAVYSNKKIKSLLGWRAKVKFSAGLKKTLKYYKKVLSKYI